MNKVSPDSLPKRERSPEVALDKEGILKMGQIGLALFAMPRPVADVDALTVFPGLGETWRVTHAVQEWERSERARNLLVAGVYEGEDTFEKLTVERLKQSPYDLTKTAGVVIQDKADNTKDQAEWVAHQVLDRNLASVALFAPSYHLLRAYATTVKSLDRHDARIPIIPVPTAVSPDSVSPELGLNMWELGPSEIDRTIKYQAKGDVSTPEELQEYLGWVWKQPILSERS